MDLLHNRRMTQTVVSTMPNGVRIVVHPMPHIHSFSAGVFVATGSRNESAQNNGISHFLEHMAFKGTSKRSAQELNLMIEHLGASMNAGTSKDSTAFFINGMSRHASDILSLLAEMVCEPSFPEHEIERERQVILQEELEYAEDPEDVAQELLWSAAYRGQALSMPILGKPANIKAVTTQDLRDYVRTQYTGPNIVIAIAGNVDADQMVQHCERLFGQLPGGTVHRVNAPGHGCGIEVKKFARVSQSFTHIGFPSACLRDGQAHYAATVAAMTFGGGMSSPLFHTIREEMGLAYHVGSSALVGDVYGQFEIEAITTPDQLPAYFEATTRLLREHAQHVDPKQVERARNQLSAYLVATLERPFGLIQQSSEGLLFANRILSTEEAVDRLQAVSAEDVRKVFEDMIKHRPAMSLVGKGATKSICEDFAAQFG